jgi:hypothetical protein
VKTRYTKSIVKNGNSLAIVIPAKLVRIYNIKKSTKIHMSYTPGELRYKLSGEKISTEEKKIFSRSVLITGECKNAYIGIPQMVVFIENLSVKDKILAEYIESEDIFKLDLKKEVVKFEKDSDH